MCWVKSRNKRNRPPMLPSVRPGTLRELPAKSRRKGGMTPSPYDLYAQGYTHATMVGTEGCPLARGSQSQKADLSSDCRLQLACMKSESLVSADQQAARNTFPGLVRTARPTTKAGCTRSR